jgi:hypothetical protein
LFSAFEADAEKVIAEHVISGELVTTDVSNLYESVTGDIELLLKPSDVWTRVVGKTIEFHPLELRNGTRRVVARIGDSPDNELRIEYVVGRPAKSASNKMYGEIATILFQLLAIAIFVEIALTFLFKSRLYQNKFDARVGWKTIISIVAAFIVVLAFKLDLFSQFVETVRGTTVDDDLFPWVVSSFITALVIAGGSSSVYQLYTRLGIRPRFTTDQSGAKLRGLGYLKVEVERKNAIEIEPISVELDDDLLGQIEPEKFKFGGEKGLLVDSGTYKLKLKSNNASGEPTEIARNVVITPNKTTSVKVMF